MASLETQGHYYSTQHFTDSGRDVDSIYSLFYR